MTGNTMRDNSEKNRFELDIDGEIVFADYRLAGQTLYIDYVESPPALRGTGAAGKLMEQVLAHARSNNLSITPICGYAASWLRRHDK